MAEVELRRDSFAETTSTTTTKKTKKVKKTKRRESTDHGSEVTITEIEQTTTDNANEDQEGYVNELNSIHHQHKICFSFFLLSRISFEFTFLFVILNFHFMSCFSFCHIFPCLFCHILSL